MVHQALFFFIGVPAWIHPLAVPQHKDFSRSPRGNQALAAFFSLVKILAVGDGHIPEVLNFGSLELPPDELSASGLKLVRVPQDIGLISPLSCAGAYDDRLRWHQLFESLPVVCEPAGMSLPSNRWNPISVFIGSPCACVNRVI
jgi:hypothetical protein